MTKNDLYFKPVGITVGNWYLEHAMRSAAVILGLPRFKIPVVAYHRFLSKYEPK